MRQLRRPLRVLRPPTYREKKNDKALFVSFLLDETDSMQSIKDDTIGGFNAYLRQLQKGDVETVFSLVSFNSSETRKRYVAEPVTDVGPLTDSDYQPQAMTPLIDASVKSSRRLMRPSGRETTRWM